MIEASGSRWIVKYDHEKERDYFPTSDIRFRIIKHSFRAPLLRERPPKEDLTGNRKRGRESSVPLAPGNDSRAPIFPQTTFGYQSNSQQHGGNVFPINNNTQNAQPFTNQQNAQPFTNPTFGTCLIGSFPPITPNQFPLGNQQTTNIGSVSTQWQNGVPQLNGNPYQITQPSQYQVNGNQPLPVQPSQYPQVSGNQLFPLLPSPIGYNQTNYPRPINNAQNYTIAPNSFENINQQNYGLGPSYLGQATNPFMTLEPFLPGITDPGQYKSAVNSMEEASKQRILAQNLTVPKRIPDADKRYYPHPWYDLLVAGVHIESVKSAWDTAIGKTTGHELGVHMVDLFRRQFRLWLDTINQDMRSSRSTTLSRERWEEGILPLQGILFQESLMKFATEDCLALKASLDAHNCTLDYSLAIIKTLKKKK